MFVLLADGVGDWVGGARGRSPCPCWKNKSCLYDDVTGRGFRHCNSKSFSISRSCLHCWKLHVQEESSSGQHTVESLQMHRGRSSPASSHVGPSNSLLVDVSGSLPAVSARCTTEGSKERHVQRRWGEKSSRKVVITRREVHMPRSGLMTV